MYLSCYGPVGVEGGLAAIRPSPSVCVVVNADHNLSHFFLGTFKGCFIIKKSGQKLKSVVL